MELLGWIGSGLLAFCAVPEAYLAWRRKGSSLTWTFLSIWWLGEVLILIPVLIDVKLYDQITRMDNLSNFIMGPRCPFSSCAGLIITWI